MTNITQKIEDRLSENKAGIKTYVSHKAAGARAEQIERQAQHYANATCDLDYIIVFLPNVERWTAVFMYSSFLRRAKSGGYIGWIADAGFFSM